MRNAEPVRNGGLVLQSCHSRGVHLFCSFEVLWYSTRSGAGTHWESHVACALKQYLPGRTHLGVVKAIQISAESTVEGQAKAITFLGGDPALTVELTLKD